LKNSIKFLIILGYIGMLSILVIVICDFSWFFSQKIANCIYTMLALLALGIVLFVAFQKTRPKSFHFIMAVICGIPAINFILDALEQLIPTIVYKQIYTGDLLSGLFCAFCGIFLAGLSADQFKKTGLVYHSGGL